MTFSVIQDVNSSQIDVNEDLDKIINWTYHWKMSFNPDLSKKAQKVIFSQKVNNVLHPPLNFKCRQNTFSKAFRNFS